MQDSNPLRCATPYPNADRALLHFYGGLNTTSAELCSATYYQDLCCILRGVFRLDGWRPGQLAACVAAIEGKDVALSLATGSGKSLCYQVGQASLSYLVIP